MMITESSTSSATDQKGTARKPDLDPEQRKLDDQIYERLAHQIDREDTLIAVRVGWALGFQGMLFAALALGAKLPKDEAIRNALLFLLPGLGVASAIVCAFGIWAAVRQLNDLRQRYTSRFRGREEIYVPPSGFWWNDAGKWLDPGALPLLFALAWLVLFLQS